MSGQEKQEKARAAGRSVPRRVAQWAAVAVGAAFALLLAAFLALQTPWAKRLLADQAAAYCQRELGWTVTMQTPEGFLPFTLRLPAVTIEDERGKWLSATDVSLAIHPWPLAAGYGAVTLVAGGLDVARVPVIPPGEPSAPAPPGRPLAFLDSLAPIPVDAGASVRVAELRLGRELAGRDLAGSLDLSAGTLKGALEASVTAALAGDAARAGQTGRVIQAGESGQTDKSGQTGEAGQRDHANRSGQADQAGEPGRSGQAGLDDGEGGQSRLRLAVRLDPAARFADLDLSLEEQPGGLVAEMAGLTGTPALPQAGDRPLAVRLLGKGPFSDFNLDLSARSGQADILSGKLAASLGRTSADDARAALTLALDPAFLPLDDKARKALGGKATLDFTGILTCRDLPSPKWKVLIENLAVSAAAGTVTVSGDTGPEGLAPRLRFSAAMTDPAALGSPTGAAAVEGTLDAGVDPAGPVTASLTLASGDMGQALALFGVGLAGKARIKAGVTGDTAAKRFQADLEVALTGLTGLTGPAGGAGAAGPARSGKGLGPALAGALGRSATLSLSGELAGEKATLSSLTLKTASANVDASGSFDQPGGAFTVKARADAPDLSRLSALAGMKLGGSATVRAEGQGTLAAPKGSLIVEGRDLVVDATALDAAGISLTAEPAGTGFSGRLDARASKGKGSLTVATAYALAGKRLGLTGLTAKGPGLDLSGGLDLSLEHKTAAGALKLNADLAGLGGFLGMGMAGRAKADVALAASGPRQDVTLRLDASGLSMRDVAVSSLQVSASLADVVRAPKGDASVRAAGLRTGTATVESLSVNAKGGGESIAFDVAAKGGLPEPFDAALAGAFAPAAGGGRLSLSRLEADAYKLKIALKKPVEASFGQGRARLDGLDMDVGGGRLTASGAMAPGRVEATADLKDLPLAALAGLGVPPLTGTASASLSVSGASAAPKLAASVDLSQVKSPALAGGQAPPASVAVRADLSGGKLRASCDASAGPGAAFALKASLPARLSLEPFAFAMAPDAPVDASLNGGVDLSVIPGVLGDDAMSLTGVLKADFTAAGKLPAPTVSGRAFLEGGQAMYVTTGTVLQNIALDLEGTGKEILLKRFSANDAHGGSFLAQGSAGIDPDKGYPFRVALAVDKLHPVHMDMVTGQVTAAIDVSGDNKGATVKGGVNVGPVEVNIPDSLPPNATPIQVEMTGKPGSRPKVQAAPSKPYPVGLDLAVDFPGRIFVRGMGLDSMWAGHLDVKGRADQPVIEGAIRIVRGQLDFFGKNFSLARGLVTFHGTNPPVPMLDIDAQAQAADITASILVTGEASRPTIDFSSDPAVPRDEILARVLFGQSLSNLTPPQALQLAQAVATLGGAGGSLDFLGKTRRLAGLDYLGVKSTGQSLGSSSVAAGKYLADGVYVEASQGLGAQSGALSVEVDVTKNITVESKIGLDAKTGAGVNWKFDY